MRFQDIIGNEAVIRSLRSMADSDRVAHSMLFFENDGCGALPIALAYVQYLNCTNRQNGDSCGECPSCRQISKLIHPDLHYVFPVNKGTKAKEDKPISDSYISYWRELVLQNPYFKEADLQAAIGVESKNVLIAVPEAKSLISKLSLSSVSEGYKAVIFYLPEKMNAEAANRLLKLVEEPPHKTVFLFITHSPEKVLQTIFSRCQSVRVLPLEKQDVEKVLIEKMNIAAELAHQAASMSNGSVGEAVSLLGEREDYNEFMELFKRLMAALISKDLMSALEVAEALSSKKVSREKKKAFCAFLTECLRKIYMLQLDMSSIVAVSDNEKELYSQWARSCSKNFCAKTITNVDKVVELIDRNVNADILFCDLVNRMFLTI